jgi:CO/xanthine dehydrogenase Mo-binding subunit
VSHRGVVQPGSRPAGMLDAHERVTGDIEFSIDVTVPGMLQAALLRSIVPHARIVRLDVSAARELPGVHAVLTGEEIAARGDVRPRFGPVLRDQPILALDRVRYAGEPVVAVAADDRDTALAALELVDVDYEELPAVFELDEALAEGAPIVHEEPPAAGPTFADVILHSGAGTNVCNSFRLRRGDVEQGFAEAEHVFEHVFSSPAVQHVPLEPHCCVADVRPGRITIHAGTQIPYTLRAQLAEIFGLPVSAVRVIVPLLGGGYGAKCYPNIEPIAACLSLAARRPVRLALTREEEFVTITKHAVRIRMKTGVRADGTIVARQVTAHFNTGAYADIGPRLIKNGGYGTAGPTDIPHVAIDSYAVYANVPPAGAFRGYGISQAAWAYETQIDMIAHELGIDPLELRCRNLLEAGQRFATGEEIHEAHFKELVGAVAERIGWSADEPPERDGSLVRAKGLSCIIKGTVTPSTSTAICKLNEDGSLHVLSSSVEMGQGVQTALALLASEEMGVTVDRVTVVQVDTDVTPYDQQTSSSRSTQAMGSAVRGAVVEIKEELKRRAAELLEAAPEDMVVGDGSVGVVGDAASGLTYEEVMRRSRAGSLIGRGTFQSGGGLDPETGQGIAAVHWHQAAGAAEVEVDLETGRVRLVRYEGAVYSGRTVNPVQAELQTEGNVAFGLGQALFEELLYDGGQLQNGTLADYMIASFRDMPPDLGVTVLEGGPDAAVHGIGETSLPAVMPAVGNAVFRACGVRITDLPITAEKVLRALRRVAEAPSGIEEAREAEPLEPVG